MKLLVLILGAAAAAGALPPATAQTPERLLATYTMGSGERVAGSGRVIDDVRILGAFTGVRVTGPVDVQLKASDREQVTIRFDDNLVGMIETRIVGTDPAVLEIGVAKGAALRASNGPKVVVEFKAISEISLRSAGDLRADRVRGPLLAVSISGSGDALFSELDVDVLGVAVAGSGDFRAAGRAGEQGYSIAGSGDILAQDLVGKVVKIRIAGSGDARVHAQETLEVKIAGSGDVLYRGNPTVTKRVAGSGTVRPLR